MRKSSSPRSHSFVSSSTSASPRSSRSTICSSSFCASSNVGSSLTTAPKEPSATRTRPRRRSRPQSPRARPGHRGARSRSHGRGLPWAKGRRAGRARSRGALPSARARAAARAAGARARCHAPRVPLGGPPCRRGGAPRAAVRARAELLDIRHDQSRGVCRSRRTHVGGEVAERRVLLVADSRDDRHRCAGDRAHDALVRERQEILEAPTPASEHEHVRAAPRRARLSPRRSRQPPAGPAHTSRRRGRWPAESAGRCASARRASPQHRCR